MRGGGFTSGNRPISMTNARQYSNVSAHSSIVLNTVFTFLRTSTNIEIPKFFSNSETIKSYYSPYHFPNAEENFVKKNIVILIMESFAQENVYDYKADPLMQHKSPL